MSTAVRGTTEHPADGAGEVLLRAVDVVKHFPVGHGSLRRRDRPVVHAVDGVSLEVRAGETLGVVGESGCGKSTLGRCLTRLTDVTSGRIELAGRDISTLSRRQLRPIRRDVQMVFQDPYASLNPRRRVGDIVAEPLIVHGYGGKGAIARRVEELFGVVGLAASHTDRYPHEFSGGQRQRVGIARALAMSPQLIVADEPVSALDVSIQAQVLNLLLDLRAELGLTYVLISHDLAVVERVSDRIAVMYMGRIMEHGPVGGVYADPQVPYTYALLSARPTVPGRERYSRVILPGDVGEPGAVRQGCPFAPRCWMAADVCRQSMPELRETRPGHWAACHFPGEMEQR